MAGWQAEKRRAANPLQKQNLKGKATPEVRRGHPPVKCSTARRSDGQLCHG